MAEPEEIVWSLSGPVTWWRAVARGTFPPRRAVVIQHSVDGERWVDCTGETAAIGQVVHLEARLAEAAQRAKEALLETHGTQYAKCGCAVCGLASLLCSDLDEYPSMG